MIKTKDLIVGAAILIFSVFVVVLVYVLTNPIYENNLKQEQLEKIHLIFPESTDFDLLPIEDSFAGLSLRAQVYRDEDPHGYIYEVNGVNNFGSLRLLVGVNLQNEIVKIEGLVLDQSSNYMNRVQAGINHYLNSNINDVVDANVGSTSSVSISTINQMMNQVKLAHLEFEFEIIPNWKEEVFSNYEVESVETNVSSNILLIETIVNNQGYVYHINAGGVYNPSGAEGDITIEFAVSASGIILGYEYILYEHTLGFQADVNNYLVAFIGENVSEIPDTYTQPSEGSHNSKKVVHSILVILKEDLS